jgi:hypothetical protein
VVVQPTENFVNNNVVKPIVNNVVKPLVNNVVVPFVNNVVIPYAKANYNALVASYNTLSNVGSQMWNGYQSFTKTVRDEQQSFYHSVNQDLQGFARDVTHLHITDMNRFLTGVLLCAATAALVVAAVYAAPEAAAAAAGSEAFAVAGVAASAEVAHGLVEVSTGALLLGAGCVDNIAGSVAD